ncbi:MAG: HesA/MoeB/ThiF family protein [Sulfolobales archaeon]
MSSLKDLSPEYIDMFSRQILIRRIGLKGQRKLLNSRVLVIGGGALGSAIAVSMARLGVGFIRIVDPEIIEISNIPRTLSYFYNDHIERTPKAYAVAREIKRISPYTEIDYRIDLFDTDNALNLARDVDLILDGLDNMRTRFLANEVAVELGKPYIYAGVEGFYGVVMPVIPGRTACLRCIYQYSGDTSSIRDLCNVFGVSVVTVLAVSSLASSIALRILLGEDIESKIYYIDLATPDMKIFNTTRNPKCPVCGLGGRELLGVVKPEKISKACGGENIFRVRVEKEIRKIDLEKIRERGFSIEEDPFRYTLRKGNISVEIIKGARVLYIYGVGGYEDASQVFKEIEEMII